MRIPKALAEDDERPAETTERDLANDERSSGRGKTLGLSKGLLKRSGTKPLYNWDGKLDNPERTGKKVHKPQQK